MKKSTIRVLLAMCLLLGGATPILADGGGGGDPPLCTPGRPQCPGVGTPVHLWQSNLSIAQ